MVTWLASSKYYVKILRNELYLLVECAVKKQAVWTLWKLHFCRLSLWFLTVSLVFFGLFLQLNPFFSKGYTLHLYWRKWESLIQEFCYTWMSWCIKVDIQVSINNNFTKKMLHAYSQKAYESILNKTMSCLSFSTKKC